MVNHPSPFPSYGTYKPRLSLQSCSSLLGQTTGPCSARSNFAIPQPKVEDTVDSHFLDILKTVHLFFILKTTLHLQDWNATLINSLKSKSRGLQGNGFLFNWIAKILITVEWHVILNRSLCLQDQHTLWLLIKMIITQIWKHRLLTSYLT